MLSALHVDVQYAVAADGVPGPDTIRRWVELALDDSAHAAELVVRIVDEAEMTALNTRFRGKQGPTNVLSFPYEAMPGVESDLLGDIVICAPVVAAEAISQGKPLESHWAHMVIHGVLHLLGYEHHTDTEATLMETLETGMLARLGFSDPYRAPC